ncbi:MAG TPA: exodeoxyribonuclease VII small subunit [Verrucomicrobiae bacterium]|nr:exodeoxyribonuclease VII small subunit [Verrucomicrobiae bacterium]
MAQAKIDYKALSIELEDTLAKLQTGGLDVDEAVALYERGMKITKELETYLKQAENKVAKIKANWEAGSV